MVADSSWMQHDPQPTNRARMSPPDMNSTVVDNGTTFPIPIGLNETDVISGAGFTDPIRLVDSPVGEPAGTRAKVLKGMTTPNGFYDEHHSGFPEGSHL